MTGQVWAILAVELAFLVLNYAAVIWMFVDVRRHTEADFAAVGQTQSLWKTLSIVAIFIGGWIFALIYYLVARRPLTERRASPA